MRINRRGLDNSPAPQRRHVKADLVHVGIERLVEAARSGVPIAAEHLGKRPMEFHL
jgi:hypothetical protein